MRERMCIDFSSISSLALRMPDNSGGLSPSLASFKALTLVRLAEVVVTHAVFRTIDLGAAQ